MRTRSSIRTAVVACVLVTAAPALAAALAPASHAPLVDAIVTGAPHPTLPEDLSRADAIALLDARAAPFLASVRAAVEAEGGRVLAQWSTAPAAHVRAAPSTLALLAAHPDVRDVTLERADAVRLVEDEPAQDEPGAANTGGRQMIQAEEAWSLGYRGEGIRVAVIGTGIDATHEAFKNADGSSRVVGWTDLVGGRPTPYDDQGHSTSTAATAAGSSWYDDPVHGRFQEAGVAPAAHLLVAKFLDANGGGSFANAISALDWAFHQGADVTVNAWGSGCTSSALSVMQVVRTTTDAGMVNVFTVGASGPGASSVGAPACSESAISVGGIASDGAAYSPSGRGPCSDIELGSPPRTCPDLVAKAVNVRTAAARGTCFLCDGSGYRVSNSMAAPPAFVGGGVALIEQMKRAITGEGWDTPARAEEEVLKITALDLGDPGPDHTFGWGLPQLMGVHAMLERADEAIIVDVFQSPAPTLREGDSGTMSFTVRNLGNAEATGQLALTLETPGGDVETIGSHAVSLGLLEAAGISASFFANSDRAPGLYHLRGSFGYTWTNQSTGVVEEGSVLREAAFEVKRVAIEHETEGLDAHTTPGAPQKVTVRIRNVGNDDAHDVVVRFTAPDHYVFAHLDALDPADARSRYAAPAPDTVHEDANFGRVTLTFHVGSLAAGEEWSFDTTLLPTRPGSHRFLVAVTYCDESGRCPSAQGGMLQQTVGLPPP